MWSCSTPAAPRSGSTQGNDTFNSAANPGMVILLSGKIELTGTINYHGLIFHANLSNSSD